MLALFVHIFCFNIVFFGFNCNENEEGSTVLYLPVNQGTHWIKLGYDELMILVFVRQGSV